MKQPRLCLTLAICTLLFASIAGAQSRRNSKGDNTDGTVLNVVASRDNGTDEQIRMETLHLYENGFEQKIKNLSFDPSPSRILLLVDNSQTLPATVEAMKAAIMEFAYEIYDGDQLFVVAYDEKPEIVQEWTDDAKKLETSLTTLRKKGNPYLFDALHESLKEVLLPLMPGTRKTAVVIIGDGLDRGSKMAFDVVTNELESENVTVYSLQIPDRTGGAYRRDQPKASVVMTQLAESTGGQVFPFDSPQKAAKAVCDELRKNRYLLSYMPANTSSYDARKIFIVADAGINVRTKAAHPPNVK